MLPHPSSFLRRIAAIVILLGIGSSLVAQAEMEKPALAWHEVAEWDVEGRAWTDHERLRFYDRFPAAAKSMVTEAVWNLSRTSTGMVARFRTDSPEIHVRYELFSPSMSGRNMSPMGASGFDLYARDDEGKWRWVESTGPSQAVDQQLVVSGLAPGEREYALYLPIRNGINDLAVGVAVEANFQRLSPRDQRPIVFYGTSINHGASASRAGMVHTAILGRWFDRPVVNLGFAGNGRMHAEVGEWLGKLDAAVFVIDCLPNLNAERVRARAVPLVKQLRAAQPDIPIVLVEDRRNTNSWILPARNAHHNANHAALQEAYATLQAEGMENLYYIPGDDLLGHDSEATADGSHPSDLGFMRQAKVFYPILEEALKGR